MGEVEHANRREVGQGDWELLWRHVELSCTGWGDSGRQEVGLGDREVLRRSVELDGDGRSPEVNKEVGRAESMSITDDAGVGGRREQENSLEKLDMTRHKDFFRVGSK